MFQLKFKKGDLITITQKEEGGWWEGTLDGRTGWFPSNYVEETAGGAREEAGRESRREIQEEVIAKNIDYRQQVNWESTLREVIHSAGLS